MRTAGDIPAQARQFFLVIEILLASQSPQEDGATRRRTFRIGKEHGSKGRNAGAGGDKQQFPSRIVRNPKRYVDPGPCGTRFSTNEIVREELGGDAMEYGLVTVRPVRRSGTSNETNWPALNWISEGSMSSKSI